MSTAACAEFLGVSIRTVRYWDAGQCRVPWSVVRLLRIVRLGDLGAMDDRWSGWTLNRNGLCSPDGRQYTPFAMTAWWLTCEQARFWRADYDRRNPGVWGASPALTLQHEAGLAAEQATAAPSPPIEAASTLTAFARRQVSRQALSAGMAVSLSPVADQRERAAAARSDAGLVISSTSGTRLSRIRMAQGFQGVRHAR